jgi:GNAT superfamily N-acetyltransferase
MYQIEKIAPERFWDVREDIEELHSNRFGARVPYGDILLHLFGREHVAFGVWDRTKIDRMLVGLCDAFILRLPGGLLDTVAVFIVHPEYEDRKTGLALLSAIVRHADSFGCSTIMFVGDVLGLQQDELRLARMSSGMTIEFPRSHPLHVW